MLFYQTTNLLDINRTRLSVFVDVVEVGGVGARFWNNLVQNGFHEALRLFKLRLQFDRFLFYFGDVVELFPEL